MAKTGTIHFCFLFLPSLSLQEVDMAQRCSPVHSPLIIVIIPEEKKESTDERNELFCSGIAVVLGPAQMIDKRENVY